MQDCMLSVGCCNYCVCAWAQSVRRRLLSLARTSSKGHAWASCSSHIAGDSMHAGQCLLSLRCNYIWHAAGSRCEMQYLFESWCAAEENWQKSTVYLNVQNTTCSVRKGVKCWMAKTEIIKPLGEDACESAIAHKLSSKTLMETEVRDHPDAPGSEARCTCMHVQRISTLSFRV